MSKAFYNIDDVLTIPIANVLKDLYGIETEKHGEKSVCAIRDERTKSCYIYPTNTYYDFGSGEGGNVITLVRRMENLDFGSALRRIAEAYGVQPITGKSNEDLISDYQFRIINIDPDLATKNFNINVEKYGIENTKRFVEKYYISVRKLENLYPKVYHNMLRDKSLKHINEEQSIYYYSLYSQYKFYQEMDGDLFADKNMMAEFETQAAELTKKEYLLSKAITKPELLKFEPNTYCAEKDLADILEGRIECQVGNTSYYDLKREVTSKNQKLSYVKVSWEEWQQNRRAIDGIQHSAFIQKDTVNVAVAESDKSKIMNALSKSREKTRQVKDRGEAR